jgi:hypothetical protein
MVIDSIMTGPAPARTAPSSVLLNLRRYEDTSAVPARTMRTFFEKCIVTSLRRSNCVTRKTSKDFKLCDMGL